MVTGNNDDDGDGTTGNTLGLTGYGNTAELDVETVDTPYIRTVQEGAAQISAAFERALADGTLARLRAYGASGAVPLQSVWRSVAMALPVRTASAPRGSVSAARHAAGKESV